MGRRPPPPVYKRPKDLGRSRTYWWHDGWIAPELRLYAPEQERTAGDDERPSPSRPSPRGEDHSPRGECAAEGAAAKASAEGGAGGSDAPERGADRPARSNLEPKKRMTWTQDLKALFRECLAATAEQGFKESPAKILEFMNQRDAGARTAGLTRTHVASFLQKHRKAQERLEIPRPRVVFDDRYAVYHAGRAMETAEMGFARVHHHHRQHDPRLVAPAPHYQHPALANAMGVPYLHYVSGASVPVVGMGTMGAMGGVGAATYGAIGNNSIGNNPIRNVPVAKGAHVRPIAPRPTDHVRPIAPRPTAAHHSPHFVLHPHDARAAEAEAEARMLRTIRLRAAELRRDRKRAAKEAAAKEAAAKEAVAKEGMVRERARTITPEVRAEPPPARRDQLGVGGSGSEGDTTTADA